MSSTWTHINASIRFDGIGIFLDILSIPCLIPLQFRLIMEITTNTPTIKRINKNMAPYKRKLVIEVITLPAVIIPVVTILVTSVPTTILD